QAPGDDGWGDRVREQVWARALPQHGDQLFAPRHVAAARPAKRLAERARDGVDATHHAVVLVRAPAVRADETDGVRVVDHDRRVVTLRKVADLRQGRHVAVHREHAIGHHHPETRTCALLELALEVLHVAVRVAKTLRLAEADAVDDA